MYFGIITIDIMNSMEKIRIFKILSCCLLLLLGWTVSSGQTCDSLSTYLVPNQYEKLDTMTCFRCKFENTKQSSLVLMFCKEDNTLYPKEQLIQNAVLRRYNDFSLSMLAWEDVLIEQKNYKALVPDLFVKEIRPNESFELLFIAKNMNDSVFLKLRNHILICEAEELKKHH